MAGHDRGLRPVVSHGVMWGGELRLPLSQKVRHGGFACSRHNYAIDGGCSSRSGHDDSSPTDGSTASRNWPLFRAMSCSSQRAIDASPCLVAHRRARDNATTKQAHRQASRYSDSTARATVERAHTRGGEDLDGGLHLHSSSGQGGGPPANHEGVQDEATATKPLSASPPLTADGVDKMYH
jgi:hypothetical protein